MAEKRWRKSKLEIDRQLFVEARNKVNSLIAKAKTSYYSDKIDNVANSKDLFTIIDF